MKLVIAVLATLAPLAAHAAYGDIEPGKCYPATVFFASIAKKLDKGIYEITLGNAPAKYRHAIYKSQSKFNGAGLFQGNIKLTGEKEVELENGFSSNVPVFEDCK